MKFRLTYITIMTLSLTLFLSAIMLCQDETATLRTILRYTDPQKRIDALNEFLHLYPQNSLTSRALYGLFNTYMETDKSDSALLTAPRCVASFPDAARGQMQMMIADALAEKGIGLDTAITYVAAAEQWARERKRPEIGSILHIKAHILYQRGNTLKAEELEREALQSESNNPDFLLRLGRYEENNGKKDMALRDLCRSILFGYSDEALQGFNSLITYAKSDSEALQLKETIVNEIIRAYVDTTKPEKIIEARSSAAALMAHTEVNLKKAREWATSAAKSPEKGESIEEFVSYQQNLALVSFAEKKYAEAAAILSAVTDLVDPWNDGFWFTIGQAYEKIGKNEMAKDAYLNALIGSKVPRLVSAYASIASERERTPAQIDSVIEKKRQSLIDFYPGKAAAQKSKTGKVVLVELFTGSECGSCQSADKAFDYLSEYYPRTAVVLLENHLHIPQPDPITNPDTWDRYMMYGGNFGTPTVVIDGTQKIIGGGPLYIGQNRFNVYHHFIKRSLGKTPPLTIEGTAQLTGGKIAVEIQLHTAKKNRKDTLLTRLYIALVEKSIDYTGGNGISRHAFVLRKLFDGIKGAPIKLTNSVEKITQSVELSQIERELQNYLDNVAKHPSWRSSFANFPGWKTRPDRINPSNVAIVAWIQDPESREVLQSFYCDVSTITK